MNRYIPLIIAAVLMLTFGCTERTEPQYRVTFVVENHTEHHLDDVTLTGEGFPGPLGVLVRTGNNSFICSRTKVGNVFTASWRIEGSEVVHSRELTCPPDFDLTSRMELIVEFWPDNEVRVRTEPM